MRALVILVAVAAAVPARAATFLVTLKNTSTATMAPGIFTLSPLVAVGAAPSAAVRDYAGGSTDEAALIEAAGLQPGVEAWVPFSSLAPGASASVVIAASPSQKLSYLSRGTGGQLVLMHPAGNAADLGVPLFDGDGLPVAALAFELARYGASTTIAFSAALPSQPAPSQLALAWSVAQPASYSTDGLALGDVHSAAGNELVALLEGGLVPGRAMVLSASSGEMLATLDNPAGNDFMGFPMVENLDRAGLSEYLVPEFADGSGSVYARRGDGSPVWSSTGYHYAGFWNMGPTAGDVRRDEEFPGNELVVADFGGMIRVLRENDGAVLNEYDLYAATAGDNVYGHATVANVHANPGNEIVVVGGRTGRVYVLGASTVGLAPQSLDLLYTSDAPLGGGYAYGGGAAVADLDGDGKVEMIVATASASGVYAYSTYTGSSACKYKWSAPGGSEYAWTSPVVGDIDGDGKPEIIVFSSDSVLSVLKVPAYTGSCTEGTVAWRYTVGNGGPAWFTPALADVTGSAGLDIVVANYTTLEVLDVGQRAPVWRYNDASAMFYPSAVIDRGVAGGPAAGIYVPGWANAKISKLTTPVGAKLPPVAWPTFMGANSRSGSR
jgi:hypothetical protein